MIRCILIGLLLVTSAGAAFSQTSEPRKTRDALMDCARQYFLRWKERATKDPDGYYLGGKESSLATAQLQDPYYHYQLYTEDIERYLNSNEEDPRVFSSNTKILFPITSADGSYLGALKLTRNDRGDGSPYREGECDYIMTGGRYPMGDPVTPEVLLWRRPPSNAGLAIDFVQFGQADLPGCLVISQKGPNASVRLVPFQASRRAQEYFAVEGIPPTEPGELHKSSRAVKVLLRDLVDGRYNNPAK